MAEQLNILGLWERTAPGEEVPEPAAPPLPPASPLDPRQEDFLGGAHSLRTKLEDACVALQPVMVRALHAELLTSFGTQRWAEQVPAWAEAIAWLVEAEAEARALSVRIERFPGISAVLFASVRSAALGRAALQSVSERGVAAALPDGRPAGYLPFVGGDFALARTLLAAACAEVGHANAQWLGYLGEAAWRLGDRHAALKAYCTASLVDPTQIDAEGVTCEPVLELLDLQDELELSDVPFSYLAVLADLQGAHALEEIGVTAEAPNPLRLAAMLRAYRRDRPAGNARIEAKRALARLAPPGLRELLRRL